MTTRRGTLPVQGQSQSDERRDAVVQATCAVIARDGLDRASMRAIAHELGSTTGVLTHYFRDKSALLAFVLDAIIAQLHLDTGDLADLDVTLDEIGPQVMRYLPADGETRVWWKVWLSFTVAALADEREAEKHRELYARLRDMWSRLFAAMQAQGRIHPEINPAVEADCLLCLVDGVGVQALISPEAMDAARQMQVITAYLAKLAPTPKG